MTYSQFHFLPLQVVVPPSSSSSSQDSTRERYRLLKFTDARDPRHKHLYSISGSMIENYESQSNPRKGWHEKEDGSTGRLLKMHDNWCLLPRDIIDGIAHNATSDTWREAPYPNRGHPVLYIPGHWGSFFQSRSVGAHGTRWTGPYAKAKSDQEIYESLRTGRGMHDGLHILLGGVNISSSDHVVDWLTSSKFQQPRENYLNGFVMDVFALDFDGEGAALHSSVLIRQAEFFARAVQTIVKGCRLHLSDDDNHPGNNDTPLSGNMQRQGGGITIVAHSIGAWVLRIATQRHPTLLSKGYIRNIITLASPLGSIPYVVDGGVHDLVKGLNNGVVGGDSTMISISGGLRDEMIPPEVCEVPYNPNSDSTSGLVSSAILATSVGKRDSDSSTPNDRFGMDHRAIVWCYDLLKLVREVVFALVVATDNGLVSSERMDVATRILNGAHDGEPGVDQTRNETQNTYQEKVNNQQLLLLRVKGYWRTVSIQLSALYNLNSLLSLCIAAALLDAYLILPCMQYLRRHQETFLGTTIRSTCDRWPNIALGILTIPSVAVMVAWTRHSGSWKSCHAQNCHVLLGTIFILTQVASICYYFITRGVFLLVAFVLRMLITPHMDFMDKQTFWGMFLHLSTQQLRSLAMIFVPLTIFICCTINILVFGNDDLVWNQTAIASYCFITALLHNSVYLIAAACQPYSLSSIEKRRGEIMVIILLMVKVTCGKVLHAFSLTKKWGQSESSSEIRTWVIFAATPFIAIVVLRIHDKMAQNFLSYWNLTNKNVGNGDIANGSRRFELVTSNNSTFQSRLSIIAHACFACCFAWNVSRNDDVLDYFMLPICTSIVVIETYMKCQSYSFEVIDVCSAVNNDELLLHCDSPKSHAKHE